MPILSCYLIIILFTKNILLYIYMCVCKHMWVVFYLIKIILNKILMPYWSLKLLSKLFPLLKKMHLLIIFCRNKHYFQNIENRSRVKRKTFSENLNIVNNHCHIFINKKQLEDRKLNGNLRKSTIIKHVWSTEIY